MNSGAQYLPGGGRGQLPQWWGIYQGYIAVNQDPLSMGRVQLRVPQVFGSTTSGWANPMVPINYVPQVGTTVTVMFVGGDPTQPVWFGNFAIPGGAVGWTFSDTAPTNPEIGQIWVNTTNGLMSEWNGAGWVSYQIGGSAIQTGVGIQAPNITGGLIQGTTIEGSDFILDAGSGNALLGYSSAASGSIVFTSSGTWKCPPGITQIEVECWGAGAGGGGTDSVVHTYPGGGGGGGAYTLKLIVPVTPGTVYTFIVGTGGGGGAAGANGVAGGTTTFTGDSGIVVTALGGSPGGHGTTGSGGSAGRAGAGGTVSAGDTANPGGSGAPGLYKNSNASYGGGGGASGSENGPGTTATNQFGGAGGTDGGAGGNGNYYSGSTHISGTGGGAPGGGGGGGFGGSNAGAAGHAGQLRITYSAATPTLAMSASGVTGTDTYGDPWLDGFSVYSGNAHIQLHVNAAGPYPAIELVSGIGSELDHPAIFVQPFNVGAANEWEQLTILGPGSSFDGKQPSISLESTDKNGTGPAAVVIGNGTFSGYPMLALTDVSTNTVGNVTTAPGDPLSIGWTIPANDANVATIYELEIPFTGTFGAQVLNFGAYISTSTATSHFTNIVPVGGAFIAAATGIVGTVRLKISCTATGTSGKFNLDMDGSIENSSVNRLSNSAAGLNGHVSGITVNTTAANVVSIQCFWGGSASQSISGIGSKWSRIGQ